MGDAASNGGYAYDANGGYQDPANSAYGYAPYSGYGNAPPKPGDAVSVPGYPDGTFSFGGWSGPNAYYLNNSTGRSVWATELFGPRPDPKAIGAAIAAAATHRRTWEKEQIQWHHYYQQQAEYAQMVYQGAPSSDVMTATGWEAAQSDQTVQGHVNATASAADVGAAASKPPESSTNDSASANDDARRTKRARTSDSNPGERAAGTATGPPRAAAPNMGVVTGIRFGTVYVWDLDETLIVFNSLLTGAFMDARRGRDGKSSGMSAESAKVLSSMAEQIEELVYTVAERALFFKQLEGRNRRCFGAALAADDGRDISDYDFAADGLTGLRGGEGRNIDAGESSPEEERRVAWRYRAVRDLYAAARAGGASPLLAAEREAAEAAVEAVDALADGWISTAEDVLSSIWQYEAVLDRLPYCPAAADAAATDDDAVFRPDAAADAAAAAAAAAGEAAGGHGGGGAAAAGTRSDVNVLVTNGELLPTVAKLLLFGLARHFHPACIYSSRDAGKEACFREVVRRFGAAAADMVAVGDGAEEEAAAVRCGMRFVKVAAAADLRRVRDRPA